MVESIISVDTVTVTGGPSSVDVQLDFGPPGQRGNLILYGIGKPTEIGIVFPETPQLLDWYINLDTSDEEYLYIYQYVNIDGSTTWTRVFKIIPNSYNVNETVNFTGGFGEVSLAISNTSFPLLTETADLNIQLNIAQTTSPFPIASSFTILPQSFDEETGTYTLPINVYALEFNAFTSSWQAVSGNRTVHLGINVI
jgi:hypothetical protein